MTAPYFGSCACGAVTATITGEPLGVRQCWCRQCQQTAAGGPTNNAMFLSADITIIGELGVNHTSAASGNTLGQYFCAKCGNPIYAQSSARLYMQAVRLGFLDEGHGLRPDTAIWLDDAPEWVVTDPQIEHVGKQPPALIPAPPAAQD